MFSACFVTAFQPTVAFAEVECSAKITYSWTPRPSSDDKKKRSRKPKEGELIEVPFETATATAASEALALQTLKKKTDRSVEAARVACRRVHEDVSGCIAAKYASTAATLKQLSFSARRELEATIIEDCNAAGGTCKDASSSEPECVELVTESEGEKKADKKRDGGKEEKAKK